MRKYFIIMILGLALLLHSLSVFSKPSLEYSARGVGGGGALAGFSISPYSDLRFVGTDMGTLFRSVNRGRSWVPIRHEQVRFGSDLEWSTSVGFSSDPKTVLFADSGFNPKRSEDGGVNWSPIDVPLFEGERIRYWIGSDSDPKRILCATTGGLLFSRTKGSQWKRASGLEGASRGTVFTAKQKVFHATEGGVFVSGDGGENFKPWFKGKSKIRAFAGGSDSHGTTLALIDSQGAEPERGFVWIQKNAADPKAAFVQTQQIGGRFIRMAENDSQTIYVTGGNWEKQYGSKIWVSRDTGTHWSLKMHVYDWDKHPYRPWPKEKLEYSAIGLDVGWNDNAPFSFEVNPKNSSQAGGTGHYFLHTTEDFGEHWSAPFTEYADIGERRAGKRWKSTGLEVVSVLKLKFHPNQSLLAYASLADLGGYVTEDGGETWRITQAKYNTNYDYAFDPKANDRVYAASGDRHDFPLNINTPIVGQGGIFVSEDRGRNWKRLTPDSGPFNRQFLSVAFDPIHRILYGGTQGGGIAVTKDQGSHWEWLNAGLPDGDKVIPQLEIDPKDGTLYLLLTGNAPEFKNAKDTGIYRVKFGKWERLRHTVKRPAQVEEKFPLWLFPSAFAVDFSKPKRDVLWLTDIENQGAWMSTGVWKTSNSGETWVRKTQFTHPTSIALDALKPDSVFVSGPFQVDGQWGVGGSLFSKDGGMSWKKNKDLPLSANLFGFTPDPKNSEKGFFLFFGGGIFYGPKVR